jgi:fused signal recognition particle receptor
MAWFRRSKESSPESSPDTSDSLGSTASPSGESAPAGFEPATAADSSSGAGGIFSRFQQGLKRTSDVLRTDIRDLFARRQGQLVDEWLDELYAILIKTDMGVGPAGQIRDFVATEFRGRVVTLEELTAAVQQKFRQLLGEARPEIAVANEGPTVILVVGVNGSGKTTSIAKLAHRFKSRGQRVVLGAGDTFRAAAVKQLKLWAERLGVDIIEGQAGGDPASVAHRTVSRALELGADVCIIDTAGRLQTQVNLMDQLKKIRRVIQKLVSEAPHEVLLVLDATAGQNGLSQAQGFSEAAGCTGIVLAKLDGSAKGGVIIPICQRFQLPVKFVGVGEQMEDLVEFQTDDFVAGLFAAPGAYK